MQAEKPDRKAIERAFQDVRSRGSPSWSAAAFPDPMKRTLIPLSSSSGNATRKVFPCGSHRNMRRCGMHPLPRFLTGSAVSEIIVFDADEGGTRRFLTFHQTPRSQTC